MSTIAKSVIINIGLLSIDSASKPNMALTSIFIKRLFLWARDEFRNNEVERTLCASRVPRDCYI